MIIKEYRIILPITVEEFQIGQLWSIAEASRRETGGGDGVLVYKNQPFSNLPLLGNQFANGQFTKKRYFLKNKVGGFVRTVAPKKALLLDEEAWNAYPYCKTLVTNEYFGDVMSITILSHHLPGKGEMENVHQLPPDKLKIREVVVIDISDDNSSDYVAEEDPKKFKSKKTGKGPLKSGWIKTAAPVMTCYKLVICEFKKFGFQSIIENKIQTYEKRLFTKFHRQVFVWIDNWYGLTLDDIRALEERVKGELDNQISTSERRGFHVED